MTRAASEADVGGVQWCAAIPKLNDMIAEDADVLPAAILALPASALDGCCHERAPLGREIEWVGSFRRWGYRPGVSGGNPGGAGFDGQHHVEPSEG